jgi:GntR family transcriptional repressor for pyruvate dehydrogenase complex
MPTPSKRAPVPGRKKLQRERVFEAVSAQIRSEIADGALKPGDKLPAERALAESFAVSRNAVREALRSLEAAGILRFQKGNTGGAFVRENNTSAVISAVWDGVSLGNISLDDIKDVRTLMLTHAVELVCELATEDDFAMLEANITRTERLAKTDNHAELLQSVGEFYKLLGLAAHNNMLALLIEAVTSLVMRLLVELNVAYTERLLPDRRLLLTMLRKRDVEESKRTLLSILNFLHDIVLQAVPTGR